jgi:hypothetical protein
MPYILEETRLFGRGRSAVGPVRPLVLEAPDDPSVVGIDFAYDLGPDILVAPIVTGRSTVLIALSKGHWQSLYRPHCRVLPADPARGQQELPSPAAGVRLYRLRPALPGQPSRLFIDRPCRFTETVVRGHTYRET